MAGEPEIAPEITPDITVVIVNFNGGDYLRGCLASLAAQTFTNFETIVIDNASTDGSLDRIVEQPMRLSILKQNGDLGFAGGNNVGARAGRGKWLALLNPDAEAAPDWLEAMMRADRTTPHAPHGRLPANQPARRIEARWCWRLLSRLWLRVARRLRSSDIERAPQENASRLAAQPPFIRVISFWNPAASTSATSAITRTSTSLSACACRASFASMCPTPSFAMPDRRSPDVQSDFSVFHGVRNGVWTYVKNMPGALLLLTCPVWFIGSLMLLARGALRGVFRPTWRGFMAAFAGLGPALLSRKQLRASRRVSVSDFAVALIWNPFSYLGRSTQVKPFPPNTPKSAALPRMPGRRDRVLMLVHSATGRDLPHRTHHSIGRRARASGSVASVTGCSNRSPARDRLRQAPTGRPQPSSALCSAMCANHDRAGASAVMLL